MKTYLISIPDSSEGFFLKLFRKFKITTRSVSEDDYAKKIMHDLIKESENSEDVSEDEVKKYFRKHGVKI